jgi:hypothetical protein
VAYFFGARFDKANRYAYLYHMINVWFW